MEIVNTYEETLAHYSMKLSHAEDELNDAIKGLSELELLTGEGWQGRAGSEMAARLAELKREAAAPRDDMEQIRMALNQLRAAIEEEIRSLEAEAAAAAAAAVTEGL